MPTNPVFNDFRNQLARGSSLIRLIFINVAVFVGIRLALVIAELTDNLVPTTNVLVKAFMLNATPNGFLHAPWGLVTSIFVHFDFIHIIMNMLFLYFAGSMFLQFFTSRRLVHLYVIGGIAGGLLEIAAHAIFPALSDQPTIVVGASGSIMAVFIAMAFHKPNLQVSLFGIIPVKLIVIAGFYLLFDLLNLAKGDGTAHFAHLGGALIGFLSVQNLHSKNNIINMSETFGQKWKSFWANLFKPKTKMRVERGGGKPYKTDEQYNLDKKAKQEKTNKILDKISKSGYESLTKAEKEFLFSQSKND